MRWEAWGPERLYLCRPTCQEPREEGWGHGDSDWRWQWGFQPDPEAPSGEVAGSGMCNLLLSPPFAACDSLQTALKHKAASFVPSPCLIGLGRVGEQASGGALPPRRPQRGPVTSLCPLL